ncbi:MAG: MmgE/PrpD family protein [Deltaproteobacteria bacterium]|nr:MmgE/PrpD family protein [Deltaproteobacteria bacterium]
MPSMPSSSNDANASIASRFVSELQFSKLPGSAVRMVKRCLLDFLGVALGSGQMPSVASGFGLLQALGNSEDATIIGCNRRAPILGAVWANSMLGSAMDFEDGYYPSVGHPASVVFPVTLAVAEREAKTPREFLTASIIGYEVCARCGMLMTRSYREKPRGSGGSSVYGAAAAAARLLGLNQEQIQMALGIAGAYMTAVPVLKSHGAEAMVKGGIPWGAVVGTAAAYLARQGFTGPPATMQDPFESEYEPAARAVLETLGREYEILNVYFKRYPSCRWTHAALDATSMILAENKIDIERIASIKVDTFKEATALDTRRPVSLEGVQFSIPFTIALLLSEGEFGVRQMSLEYLGNPIVQALADRVQLDVDPILDRLFPEHRPARVTITTDQGLRLTREVIEVHGEPGSDFAGQGVKNKFLGLASERLGRAEAEKVYQTAYTLDSFSTLDPLMALLKG